MNRSEPVMAPTNIAAIGTAGLDALAPPQISEAANLGRIEGRQASDAFASKLGVAPGYPEELARRFFGFMNFYRNSPELQELRGAQQLDAESSPRAFNLTSSNWGNTSDVAGKEELRQDVPAAIMGTAAWRFGK